MASENPAPRATQRPRSASENTDAALRGYTAALARAPLAAATRRTYTSKVRGYLMWLATADVDGDPSASRKHGTGLSATTAPGWSPWPNAPRPRSTTPLDIPKILKRLSDEGYTTIIDKPRHMAYPVV